MIHQIGLEANKGKSSAKMDSEILESFLKKVHKFEKEQEITP